MKPTAAAQIGMKQQQFEALFAIYRRVVYSSLGMSGLQNSLKFRNSNSASRSRSLCEAKAAIRRTKSSARIDASAMHNNVRVRMIARLSIWHF